MFPVKLAYTLTFHCPDIQCEFEWTTNNKAVQIHPVILWWMSHNWNIKVALADMEVSSGASQNTGTKALVLSVLTENTQIIMVMGHGMTGQW
jgi:hypothetical protein